VLSTVIDLAILGLLKEQDLHGYELRKRLAELPGSSASRTASRVSFGSLYPALARLEKAGLVKGVEAGTRAGRPVPSTGSLAGELAAFRARHLRGTGGRSKKVYGLTELGESHLVDLLADANVADDRTFTVKVAFCRYLAPQQRLELFERRRGELLSRAAERRQGSDRVIDRYLRTLRERDEASLTDELAWLDRLIADERAGVTALEESTQ
jgi:DNA-binding PadR family transcriptional regulator